MSVECYITTINYDHDGGVTIWNFFYDFYVKGTSRIFKCIFYEYKYLNMYII